MFSHLKRRAPRERRNATSRFAASAMSVQRSVPPLWTRMWPSSDLAVCGLDFSTTLFPPSSFCPKARCSSGHSVFNRLFATSLLLLVGTRSFRVAAFRVAAVFPIHQTADSVAESGFDLVQVISDSINILLKNSGRLFGGQAINFPQLE